MTRSLALVFIAACAGTAPPPPPPPPITLPEHYVARVDAGIDAGPPQVGEACRDNCTCLPWQGGYCSKPCDGVCSCVATPQLGDVCARGCASDRDCRWDEGYVCDATWHACLLPNTAAIVPRRCAPAGGQIHDDAFATPELVSAADGPPSHSPAAAPGALAYVGGAHAGSEVALARDHAAWIVEGSLVVDDKPGIEGSDCAADRSCPARPRLAASAKGAYVAYSGDVIGTRVRAVAGGDAVTALTGARGDIALSDDGRVHVIAMQGGLGGAYGAAQHAIEYTVSKDGAKSFAKPVVVSARDELIPAYFANPTLAVDDKRNWLYVAYVRGGTDAVWDVVIAASKDKGATWTRRSIGDGCSIHMLPAIAVDPVTGTIHLTYYDSRAEVGRYVHATCAAGAIKCVEKGAIERTPFAALGTGRLDASWLGDHEALYVDDKTLHAVWTQPVGSPPVSRVFHATAKLR